jgi:flagellar biosynthesis/type III secretory pathway protein FliH
MTTAAESFEILAQARAQLESGIEPVSRPSATRPFNHIPDRPGDRRPLARNSEPTATQKPDEFDRAQLSALAAHAADQRLETFREGFQQLLGDGVAQLMAEERERTDKLIAELRAEIAMLRSSRKGRDGQVIDLPRSAWTKRRAA